MPDRPVALNTFIAASGYHEAAWRVLDDDPRDVVSLAHFVEAARIAERAGFDSVFLADSPGVVEFRTQFLPQAAFDPIQVMTALAARTERIALIATASTTYSGPAEALARRFATLDAVSGGRAGWNVVTTRIADVAGNFGREHPSHADRYERAHAYVAAARRAWDRWGVPHPLLVQAGSSPAGIDLAARIADLVFIGQPTVEDAVRFRAHVLSRAASFGRRQGVVRVLPALPFILGSTEAEARERRAALEAASSVEFRWRNLAAMTEIGADEIDPHAPLPEPLLDAGPRTSIAKTVYAAARREPGLTFAELGARFAVRPGALDFTGTPEQLADLIETWWRAGAADGFTLMPMTLPRELADFAEHVVPILQARSVVRERPAVATR